MLTTSSKIMSESNYTSFSGLSSSDSSSSDEQPSTKQGKPSKVGRKTLKPKCLAKSKTKGGKGKLSEDEIVDICDKIKNEQSRLQTSTRDKVLSIFKQSISGLDNILCGTDYEHLVGIIVEDFISVYKEKVTVSSKYESFQITMFTKQRDYLYVAGAKQDLAKTVFQHVTDIYRVFPVLYQAVCDSIQCLIVELVDNKADKGDKKELLEEEDSQLYRMHGWVLYELVKKSEYKDTVKQFKLGDKSELPQAIKFLDVGTKVILFFWSFQNPLLFSTSSSHISLSKSPLPSLSSFASDINPSRLVLHFCSTVSQISAISLLCSSFSSMSQFSTFLSTFL